LLFRIAYFLHDGRSLRQTCLYNSFPAFKKKPAASICWWGFVARCHYLLLLSRLFIYFERLLMRRIMTIILSTALALALNGCACAPGFVGFDSRCGFLNFPSGQP